MTLKYRWSFAFFFTFLVLVFSVDAAHGYPPAHFRRSHAFKLKPHRQLDLPSPLGDVVGILNGPAGPSVYNIISFLFMSNLFPRFQYYPVGHAVSIHYTSHTANKY